MVIISGVPIFRIFTVSAGRKLHQTHFEGRSKSTRKSVALVIPHEYTYAFIMWLSYGTTVYVLDCFFLVKTGNTTNILSSIKYTSVYPLQLEWRMIGQYNII